MSVSHPNLLQLIAVDIDPRSGQCSMISEMMKENIRDYISQNSANRLRLVRVLLNCLLLTDLMQILSPS